LQSVLDRHLKNSDKPDSSDKKNDSTDNINHLNKWDQIIFLALYKKYFPNKIAGTKSYGQLNLDLTSFIMAFLNIKEFEQLNGEMRQIAEFNNDEQINDLIYRFFYSRLFAKLFFGAGFGQLSIMAGFNHLALSLALLKIKIKQNAKARGDNKISMDDAISAVVQLEKSLGELKIGPYGAAIMELLLGSKQRIRRILHLS
jgi:hypothetical protein